MHWTADITNIIVKDVTSTGMNLRHRGASRHLFPRNFSYNMARPWFEEQWANSSLARPYIEVQSPALAALSRMLRPYGSTWIPQEHSPVNLSYVGLLKCLAVRLSDPVGKWKVLHFLAAATRAYHVHSDMIITGDWHAYWPMVEAVSTMPEEFAHFVPMPGPFHIALNAQEAILKHFRPLLNALWEKLTGESFPIIMSPLFRKHCLDLFYCAWLTVRPVCTNRLAEVRHCPIETFGFLHLFDELIPVSLDVYACCLHGTWEEYQVLLLRAFHLFVQLGKSNYIHAVLLFIATSGHWKEEFPEVRECFVRNLEKWSDEEVELYHATIRHHCAKHRTPESLAKAVNFHGALKEKMQNWCTCTREGIPLTTWKMGSRGWAKS